MSVLTVVARLKAKPGKETELERELRGLLDLTRAEKGCINYDLHRSSQDKGLFVFHENWASREEWDDHMKSEHIQAFSGMQDSIVESWELFDGEKIA